MSITMETLSRKCEALSKEFNTAARDMDAKQLAAFRKRFAFRNRLKFENSWVVRIRANVEDVFCVESCQEWTQSTKGNTTRTRVRLVLTSPHMPGCSVALWADKLSGEENGAEVMVKGRLEGSVLLLEDAVRWKSASFIGRPVIGGE